MQKNISFPSGICLSNVKQKKFLKSLLVSLFSKQNVSIVFCSTDAARKTDVFIRYILKTKQNLAKKRTAKNL